MSVDEVRAELRALNEEKDKAYADYKKKARKLTAKLDKAEAEEAAAERVAGMSDAERQAVAAELAKSGGDE